MIASLTKAVSGGASWNVVAGHSQNWIAGTAILSYCVGLEPLGANPVPNLRGMVIATVALVQLAVGVWLDRHYNRRVARFYLWAAMYPLFHWMMMLVITVIATPRALLGRSGRTSHGKTERVPADENPLAVGA